MVADGVRKLAERTSMSLTEIAGMVEDPERHAQRRRQHADRHVTQADKGVALARPASRSSASVTVPCAWSTC
ncbi:MAG: hypothetical protein U1E85_08675 [Rhodocyclaceae bacterium]